MKKAFQLAATVLQSVLVAGLAGVILALAAGIAFTAITGEIAPWLEWITTAFGLKCVNYW